MQNLRKITLPFGWLYGLIVWLRNRFFDQGWLRSKSYSFPVICVGNLSVGGTGKSPMIEYLIRLLNGSYKVATLNRGYKRKTTGYYLLSGGETAQEVGDEPLQFKTKYPQIQVAVDADRQHGIEQLRESNPRPDVILLDDAFQHRKVKPSFSVLLTAYDHLYTDDLMLPAGNLREPKSGAKRADIIVVTKCPPNLSREKQNRIRQKLKPHPHQSVYFSFIAYAEKVTNTQEELPFGELKNFCLVTGIARPEPLVDFLGAKQLTFTHRQFSDHHNFTSKEIRDLAKENLILTTEKDFMRLKDKIPLHKLFYLPIRQEFIAHKAEFDTTVFNHLKRHYSAR